MLYSLRTIILLLGSGLVQPAVSWAVSAPLGSNHARETVGEAAANTKRLLHDHPTGVISTVFPSDSTNAGRPFAIMEYAAPCHADGSLTFLLFPESVTTQNILHSKGGETTYTVSEPFEGARSAVAQPRVALIGNITILHHPTDAQYDHLSTCYRRYHPDVFWLPGRTSGHPFDSMWARFQPEDIYYVGGFGDTHYIGHIPVEMYRAAKVHSDAQSGAPRLVMQEGQP